LLSIPGDIPAVWGFPLPCLISPRSGSLCHVGTLHPARSLHCTGTLHRA
jgi:hypothetical protein